MLFKIKQKKGKSDKNLWKKYGLKRDGEMVEQFDAGKGVGGECSSLKGSWFRIPVRVPGFRTSFL